MSKGKHNSSDSTQESASAERVIKKPAKAGTIQLSQVDKTIRKVVNDRIRGNMSNSSKLKG